MYLKAHSMFNSTASSCQGCVTMTHTHTHPALTPWLNPWIIFSNPAIQCPCLYSLYPSFSSSLQSVLFPSSFMNRFPSFSWSVPVSYRSISSALFPPSPITHPFFPFPLICSSAFSFPSVFDLFLPFDLHFQFCWFPLHISSLSLCLCLYSSSLFRQPISCDRSNPSAILTRFLLTSLSRFSSTLTVLCLY